MKLDLSALESELLLTELMHRIEELDVLVTRTNKQGLAHELAQETQALRVMAKRLARLIERDTLESRPASAA